VTIKKAEKHCAIGGLNQLSSCKSFSDIASLCEAVAYMSVKFGSIY